MTETVLIGIIVSLLSFLVLVSFLTSAGNTAMDELGEIQCRGALEAQSTKAGQIGEFFLGLTEACPKDEIEESINLGSPDEVFEIIAERSQSCWNRYGKGEIDFLSSYETSGEYCFPCSQISFEGSSFSYDYNEFIEWTKENRPEGQNEYYSDLILFPYIDTEAEEYEELKNSLEEALVEIEEEEDDLGLGLYLIEHIIEIEDMKNKKITSDEDLFVVFNYQRIEEEDMNKVLRNVGTDAAIGLTAGVAAGVLLKGPVGLVTAPVRLFAFATKMKNVGRVARLVNQITSIRTLTAAGGIAGGIAGGYFSDNYLQTVELLDEEEYYRNCGIR